MFADASFESSLVVSEIEVLLFERVLLFDFAREFEFDGFQLGFGRFAQN